MKAKKQAPSSSSTPIEKLKWVMARLRDREDGCPWDCEQTNETILPYTIEEAYEVADAIENGISDDLKEELGDLLFQIMFYTQMASEDGIFDFDDVAEGVTKKMINRHPHVFGNAKVDKASEVNAIWDAQKDKEKKTTKEPKGALDGITKGLPALLRAKKLQKKAAKVGFEWKEKNDALLKVQEEINEFNNATNNAEKEEEFGDILFAIVNLGRMQNIDSEEALRKANNKFIKRFEDMEKEVGSGKFKDLSLGQMLNLWKRQK